MIDPTKTQDVLQKTVQILINKSNLQPQEVAALRLADLHLAGKEPYLRLNKPNQALGRQISLDLDTHRLLINWLVVRPDSSSAALFPGQNSPTLSIPEIEALLGQTIEQPSTGVASKTETRQNRPFNRPNSRPVRPLSRPEVGAPPLGFKVDKPLAPPPMAPEMDKIVPATPPDTVPVAAPQPPVEGTQPVTSVFPKTAPETTAAQQPPKPNRRLDPGAVTVSSNRSFVPEPEPIEPVTAPEPEPTEPLVVSSQPMEILAPHPEPAEANTRPTSQPELIEPEIASLPESVEMEVTPTVKLDEPTSDQPETATDTSTPVASDEIKPSKVDTKQTIPVAVGPPSDVPLPHPQDLPPAPPTDTSKPDTKPSRPVRPIPMSSTIPMPVTMPEATLDQPQDINKPETKPVPKLAQAAVSSEPSEASERSVSASKKIGKTAGDVSQDSHSRSFWQRYAWPIGAAVVVGLCAMCGVGGFALTQSGLVPAETIAGLGRGEAETEPTATSTAVAQIGVPPVLDVPELDSPLPTPTNTPEPPPTETAVPPTEVPTEVPTETAVPTETPIPADTAVPTDTPEPTETPTLEPTATPVPPTPTPTEDSPFNIALDEQPIPTITPTAPRDLSQVSLIGPENGTTFISGNQIILEWEPVGLEPSEYYALRVVYRYQGEERYGGGNVTEPRWEMPIELAQQVDGPDFSFEWFVLIERENSDGTAEEISPPSERRTFKWGG